MSAFSESIAEFIAVATSSDADSQAMQVAAGNVCATIAGTDIEQLDTGLRRLAETIATAEITGAAVAAICCGAIVENGGDPDIALECTLYRLQESLTFAQLFAEACEAADEEDAEPSDEEDEPDPVEQHGEEVAEWMPENAVAFQTVEPLGMGAIAMLSRSTTGRKKVRHQFPDLASLADDLAPYHERAHYLSQLLNVLDDERLIVLHPEQKKGYRVRMNGVATNFELFVLLADAVIGDPAEGWLEGHKPDPVAVAACRDRPAEIAAEHSATGSFNFWNWRALRPDGSLPHPTESMNTWIWMEGMPADIETIDQQRVILLGPAPYLRHWHAGRCFEGMIADVHVESKLSEAEFKQWMTKLTQAPR